MVGEKFKTGGGGSSRFAEDAVADALDDSADITIEREGLSVTPVYVGQIDYDAYGAVERLTDGCGNTEARTNGATGWQITIEGIVTQSQWETMMRMGLKGNEALITSNGPSDTYVIDDVSFSETDEVNNWVDKAGFEENAVQFRITTKDPTKGQS